MINFSIEEIRVNFLNCSVKLKVQKEIKPDSINYSLEFFLKYKDKLIMLDTGNYHSLNLPINPRYYDYLLMNDDTLNFLIYIPESFSGVNCKIIAMQTNSQILFWESENIFLKTKEIGAPIFTVDNFFDGGLKSKITFNKDLVNEQVSVFYLEQRIKVEGNEHYQIEKLTGLPIKDTLLHYPHIKKYGSYEIETIIYNRNNEIIKRDLTHYIKIHEPIAIVYKQPTAYNNFLAKPIRNIMCKKNNEVYRINDFKIKL